MDQTTNLYSYNGAVLEFDRCIANNWKGSTYAKSKKEAKRNLTFQFKKQNNRLSTSKIVLPNDVILERSKLLTRKGE